MKHTMKKEATKAQPTDGICHFAQLSERPVEIWAEEPPIWNQTNTQNCEKYVLIQLLNIDMTYDGS